ncbi:MAG: alanine racemase [Solirubrobacteraceae bacterium]
MSRARALINLAAIERNCARLKPSGVELCAVVKADAYGHGAVPCARAALAGGATWLAVAAAAEAKELRDAGIDAAILVMGALTRAELEQAVGCRADVVAWTEELIAWASASRGGGARVHVKLDSGMGRLGTRDVELADRLVAAIEQHPKLELGGLMTHFATADERGDGFFAEQLERFSAWTARHPQRFAHAANSAATLREARSHFGMVRCGVGIYGLDPFGRDGGSGLEPALELESWVAAVKPVGPGDSAGYGRRFVADRRTMLGVVPVGYGDGVRRGLTNNADVFIDDRRHPLVGTVSMDNVTVDLGPDTRVEVGARAVLLGGGEITAEELAERLDTINYEITCGVAARVPRTYHRDGLGA